MVKTFKVTFVLELSPAAASVVLVRVLGGLLRRLRETRLFHFRAFAVGGLGRWVLVLDHFKAEVCS